MKMEDDARGLSTLVAVVANDPTIGVTLTTSGQCYIDYARKHITISDELIPLPHRKNMTLVRKYRYAFAQHEAQHWLFLHPVHTQVERWIESKGRHASLARLVQNIVDDYRVNTWLSETYSYDIGQRVHWVVMALGRSWRYTLRKAIESEMDSTDFDNVLHWLCQATVLSALYNVAPSEFRDEWARLTGRLVPESLVNKAEKISEAIRDSRYVPSEGIIEVYEKVFRMFYAHAGDTLTPDAECDGESDGGGAVPQVVVTSPTGQELGIDLRMFPRHLGGRHVLDADDIPCDDGGPQPDSNGCATVVGKGNGMEVASPAPDPERYNALVNRNMQHIVRLLDKLKQLRHVSTDLKRYQKSGKLMTKKLGRFAVQRRPQENIYQRTVLTEKKASVKVALVVDLSGSMRTETARDALTVIAEVGGRWLSDDALAVFVFGSGYAKVKGFSERYHGTRDRIGGVFNMGGTVMAPCLEEVHRMFSSVRDGRIQVCVIVSDFNVSDIDATRNQIKLMQRDGISVLGVGMCSSDLDSVRGFCGENSTYVGDICALPDLFFEEFRRIASHMRCGRR